MSDLNRQQLCVKLGVSESTWEAIEAAFSSVPVAPPILTPEQVRLDRAAMLSFHASKRRTIRMARTPAWADEGRIRAIYGQAQALTAATGVMHHVDHVIPLQGELVSGLHVPENMQVLTGVENSRKRNKFEVLP